MYLPVAIRAFGCHQAPTPVRILVPVRMRRHIEDLPRDLPSLELVYTEDHADALRQVAGCAAAVGYVAPELVETGSELRWVQVLSAGVEALAFCDAMRKRDIALTNAGATLAPQLAEQVFALLLGLTRDMRHHVEAMNRGRWEPEATMPLLELYGKTVLILGLGSIGLAVAERARAFGMRVLATKASDFFLSSCVDYVGRPDEMVELLPQADVVVVCVPNTPGNRRLLGPGELAAMKRGALLINMARGVIVDTDALLEAIRTGHLGGAGLDVTDPEPLPEDHPLYAEPRVLISPHVGGLSDKMHERLASLVRDNITRFVRGLPLKNRVDYRKGY